MRFNLLHYDNWMICAAGFEAERGADVLSPNTGSRKTPLGAASERDYGLKMTSCHFWKVGQFT